MVQTAEREITGDLLRRRLDGTAVKQADIAARLGYTEPIFSRILNGRDRMPEGFAERFDTALVAIAHERYERALAAAGGTQ